ncbi:MAG: DHH family phosphoesterase [Parcubacteria group bacterium]|jgi:single-stranded DNA-specific DHH superfamily exonuclease
MKFILGSEKDFSDFVDLINKEDRVGIITHTDLDGVASAIFLEKILESKGIKVSKILFLKYELGMFDNPILLLKQNKISKLFLTDMNADEADLLGFEKLRKTFDCFLIDHHPINDNLINRKNIIKNETNDCSAFVLYNLAKLC